MKHNNHSAHLTPWSRRTFLSNGALGISSLGLAGALGLDSAMAQVSGFPNRAVQLSCLFRPVVWWTKPVGLLLSRFLRRGSNRW